MNNEAIKKLSILLQGRIPSTIERREVTDETEQQLINIINQLIIFMREMHNFIIPLSKGELTDLKISPNNFLCSPFKELQSRLRHLTWQAKQVARSDFSQRVDFMGDFSEAFNSMIISLAKKEQQLKMKIADLENALSHIRKLEGILPICSHCKKIRIEGADPEVQKNWVELESYLYMKIETQFSHSICPDCAKKLYPDYDLYND